jgi:hypothetical protein
VKVGDTITVLGPSGMVITGTVLIVESMKTRLGWYISIAATSIADTAVSGELAKPSNFALRPEDEGRCWIYGDDEAQKAALIVAEALWERTKLFERRPYSQNQASTRRKVTGVPDAPQSQPPHRYGPRTGTSISGTSLASVTARRKR